MANTTNFGWETPDDTDLVKDGAAAIRTLGSAIDTSFVDLKGGTTGQVLAKASNTDLDFTWSADAAGIPPTIFDAKGDLIAASAADTAARLAVGTNGQYLSADSSTATGLKWVTPTASTASLSLITSGNLSGSSLTLSSLSTYDTLILMITNLNQSNAAQLRLRVNNNSTSNYWSIGFRQSGSTTARNIRAGDDSWQTNQNVDSGANGNEFVYVLTNCKAAGFTSFGFSGTYNSATRSGEVATSGIYAVAEAVSSLVLEPTAGTFSGGDYRIYGG
jgi:hypothetical protein